MQRRGWRGKTLGTRFSSRAANEQGVAVLQAVQRGSPVARTRGLTSRAHLHELSSAAGAGERDVGLNWRGSLRGRAAPGLFDAGEASSSAGRRESTGAFCHVRCHGTGSVEKLKRCCRRNEGAPRSWRARNNSPATDADQGRRSRPAFGRGQQRAAAPRSLVLALPGEVSEAADRDENQALARSCRRPFKPLAGIFFQRRRQHQVELLAFVVSREQRAGFNAARPGAAVDNSIGMYQR